MSLRSNKNELGLLLGYFLQIQYSLGYSIGKKPSSEETVYALVLVYMNIFRILLLSGFTGTAIAIVLWETLRLYSVPLILSSMGFIAILTYYTNPYQKKYPFEIYKRITGLRFRLPESTQINIAKRTSAFLLFQFLFFAVFELPLSLFAVKLLMHA